MGDDVKTWCPKCGPYVDINDSDGDDHDVCDVCGSDCVGPGATHAIELLDELWELRQENQLLNERVKRLSSELETIERRAFAALEELK